MEFLVDMYRRVITNHLMDEHKTNETIEEFYEKYKDARIYSLSRYVLFPAAKHPLPSLVDLSEDQDSWAQIAERYGGGDYILRAMLEEGWTSDEDSFKFSIPGEPKPRYVDQKPGARDRYQEELSLFMQAALNLAEAFAEISKEKGKDDDDSGPMMPAYAPRVKAFPRLPFAQPAKGYSNCSFRLGMGMGAALSAMGMAALSEDLTAMLGETFSGVLGKFKPPVPDQIFPIVAVPPSRESFYDDKFGDQDEGEKEE